MERRHRGRKAAVAVAVFLLFTVGYPVAVDQAWLRYNPYVLPLTIVVAGALVGYWFLHSDYALMTCGTFVSKRGTVISIGFFIFIGALVGSLGGASYYGLLKLSKTHIAALLDKEGGATHNSTTTAPSVDHKPTTTLPMAPPVTKSTEATKKHVSQDKRPAVIVPSPNQQTQNNISRILTQQQEQELIETLRATPEAHVRIVATGNVPEVHLYAAQIQRAFEAAQWHVFLLDAGSGVVMEGGVASSPINLSVYTYQGDHASEVAIQAFKNTRIQVSIQEGELPYSGPSSATGNLPVPSLGIQIGLQQ